MAMVKMMVVRVVVVRRMMEKNKEEKDSSWKPMQKTCAGQPSSGFPPLEPAPACAGSSGPQPVISSSGRGARMGANSWKFIFQKLLSIHFAPILFYL